MVFSVTNVETTAISIKLTAAYPQGHSGSRLQMLFFWRRYLVNLLGEVSYYQVLPDQIYHANLPVTLSIHYTEIKVIFLKHPQNCVTSLCKTLQWLPLSLRVKPPRCPVTFFFLALMSLPDLTLLQLPWPACDFSSNKTGAFLPSDLCTSCFLFLKYSSPRYLPG